MFALLCLYLFAQWFFFFAFVICLDGGQGVTSALCHQSVKVIDFLDKILDKFAENLFNLFGHNAFQYCVIGLLLLILIMLVYHCVQQTSIKKHKDVAKSKNGDNDIVNSEPTV